MKIKFWQPAQTMGNSGIFFFCLFSKKKTMRNSLVYFPATQKALEPVEPLAWSWSWDSTI